MPALCSNSLASNNAIIMLSIIDASLQYTGIDLIGRLQVFSQRSRSLLVYRKNLINRSCRAQKFPTFLHSHFNLTFP